MPTPIKERVASFIRVHGLVGSRMVIAVSGGPDSICLLHVLSTLRDELCLTLHVAHLDHGLRQDSAQDAAYVADLAKKLNLPVTIEEADIRSYCRKSKLSIEEGAREVRYRFLAGVAESLGALYIATGHTRSDHVETILLHIIRGTGLRGLIGLKVLTPWTIEGRKIAIVRPLLEVGREETDIYCRRLGLQPRLDITNRSLTPLRNRIRLELLPLLKKYNRGIEESMLRLAAAAGEDITYFDEEVSSHWDRVVKEENGLVVIDKGAMLALSPSLQAHLLRRALEHILGSIKDIEMRHIRDIMSTITLPAGRRIALPFGLGFVVGYGEYWLGREADIPSPYPPLEGEHRLNVPGTTEIPGWQVEALLVPALRPVSSDGLTGYFDFDNTGKQLIVRGWRRGDRFVPLGLVYEKKLGEFMIAEKIPRRWRQNVPVIASPQQIIWLVGYRIDERSKVTHETSRVLKLEFKNTI